MCICICMSLSGFSQRVCNPTHHGFDPFPNLRFGPRGEGIGRGTSTISHAFLTPEGSADIVAASVVVVAIGANMVVGVDARDDADGRWW